jgi:hypothetical protein
MIDNTRVYLNLLNLYSHGRIRTYDKLDRALKLFYRNTDRHLRAQEVEQKLVG